MQKDPTMHLRRHDRMMASLFALGLIAAPLPVMGAPFCVQTQAIPPQCIYTDAAACNARAAQMGGRCAINPAEVHPHPGIGHYCLLTLGQVSECIYPDLATCTVEAQHQQGVCVDSPDRPESPAADPFRDVRPLRAGG
jgi:hypothetical protein